MGPNRREKKKIPVTSFGIGSSSLWLMEVDGFIKIHLTFQGWVCDRDCSGHSEASWVCCEGLYRFPFFILFITNPGERSNL